MAYLASCGCGVCLHITESSGEILQHWEDVMKLIEHHKQNPKCIFKEVRK